MATLKSVIIIALLAYAMLCALLYFGQRALMYFPDRARTLPASVSSVSLPPSSCFSACRTTITVDPKDYVVRQAVLYDQFQNTVTMTFNRVAINPGLSDTLFAFTPPKDAAVVPLDPR